MFILGIDIGTQSLKAVVLGEGLRPRGAGSAAYEPRFPQPLWAEQDPRLWLEGLSPAIGRALAEAGIAAADVGALGIAGQLDGCLPVDRQGEALGPCLIWMDRRASAETEGLPAETVLAKGGVVLDASHMAAKIRWLKRHHAEAGAIARFHQPTPYVVARLTGRAVLDHAVASTSMLYGLWERQLDPELCGLFGIAPEELPEIDASEALAGSLTSAGAALTLPLTATVEDSSGHPVAGVSVKFTVTNGAGTLSATFVTTDGAGDASANYTLGELAGLTEGHHDFVDEAAFLHRADGVTCAHTLARLEAGDKGPFPRRIKRGY